MAYHPNIPRANDNPTVSQGQLLDNFGTLNTDFAINHVPFTAGGNAGFHTKVQFTDVLVADPVVTGTQSAVYPKLVDGEPQLFFNNPVQVYPLTGLPFVNGTITNVKLNIAMTKATITSDGYNLLTGNSVTFLGVGGITGLNGNTFPITMLTANTFSVTGTFGGSYTGGGTFTSPSSTNFGFITPWGWTINCGQVVVSSPTFTQTFAIPYSSGFDTYTGQLTPFGVVNAPNQYAITSIIQTNFTGKTSSNDTFNFLVIGST